MYSRTKIEYLINEFVVGREAERDSNILLRMLLDGITYERLAEEFDMSRRHIKNIVYKRQEQIFKSQDV